MDLQPLQGATKVWIPLPSIESDYQRSLTHRFCSNGSAVLAQDGREGTRMLVADIAPARASALR